jgi:hypothetical protein
VKDRKNKAFYFIATLLTLGFVVPATLPATLPAYIAFASALGTLTTLFFGANVVNKKMTEKAYIEELKQKQGSE